jgi:hypothetical protein
MNPLFTQLKARSVRWLCLALVPIALVGCGAGAKPAPAPPCEEECQDGVALRALRTMMRFAFNAAVAGKPVGAQDETLPCLPSGSGVGSVRVFGDAESNPEQGASFLTLSYDFRNCSYSAPPDPTADQNYSVTLTGLIGERGTLSQQPTSITALLIQSDSVTLTGSVYDPALDYSASNCELSVDQNGSAVSGLMCGRAVGFTF